MPDSYGWKPTSSLATSSQSHPPLAGHSTKARDRRSLAEGAQRAAPNDGKGRPRVGPRRRSPARCTRLPSVCPPPVEFGDSVTYAELLLRYRRCGRRQGRKVVHHGELLEVGWGGSGDVLQERSTQPEQAELGVERADVLGRDLGDGPLPRDQAANRMQSSPSSYRVRTRSRWATDSASYTR